jgi:hypothetical protein
VIEAGHSVHFVLSYGLSFQSPLPATDSFHAPERTKTFWRQWSDRCPEAGPWTEAVKRSLITLKALTYAPTGGIVAAATTSLPERLGGVRNWDYRYCWLRDATFTLQALMHLGYHDEARAWRDWLIRAVAGSPEQVQIVYGVGGERWLPEMIIPWLDGVRKILASADRQRGIPAAANRRPWRGRRRNVSSAQGRHGANRARQSLAAQRIGISGSGLGVDSLSSRPRLCV